MLLLLTHRTYAVPIPDHSQRYFSFFLCFVFSLCERKNETQMKVVYLAAAGKAALESSTA
jgi:hypothetical protein